MAKKPEPHHEVKHAPAHHEKKHHARAKAIHGHKMATHPHKKHHEAK
jgi:hypothetical protein